MEILPEIVKIISEDSILMANRLKFVHSLGISETKVAPYMKLHDMGHCRPYELVHNILSEWITNKKESATIKELRKILGVIGLNLCSFKLRNLDEMYPGSIKLPGVKQSSETYALSTRNLTKHAPTPIVYGLKDVVLNFMGRDAELATLHEHFHSRNCRSVHLSGLGGIGKTELAKQFSSSLSDTSGSHQIAKSWLAGESSQTLINSTTEFCHQLRLTATGSDGQPLGIQTMLQNILGRLQSTSEYSRWLVVIDNVDETHQEFQRALETLFDFGSFVFLLVTSRRRDICAGEFLQVRELKLQDSITFVKTSLKITTPSSETPISALCNQLGNFPLALSQAVSCIKQQQRQTLTGAAYGVQNYLNELVKNETLGLDQDHRFAEYPKATLRVWHLTLDRIAENHGAKGRMALNLLNVMAFIIPDNIQISSLNKLYKRFYSTEEIDFYQDQIHSWLTVLLQYSLISSCNSLINIHRLVQLALRERMTSKTNHDNQIMDVEMLKSFWTSFDRKEWNREDIANILKIWKHSCSHPELHDQIAAKSYYLSIQLDDLVMLNESYNFATECCKFLLDIYGPEKKQYLLMEQQLAIAMKRKGHYESSLQKFTFVYGKLKELLGEEYRHTMGTGHWIAHVLIHLKRYEESLEWGQKVLQSRIRIFGEKNKSTMDTKHNVALALENLGKGEEALKMYNEILEWQAVHLGKHHLSTLATRENIGVCFYNVGNYAEALDIFQDVLSLRQQHSGVDHPNTLNTKGWLADSLEEMGEIDKALKIWEEVAVVRDKVLGPDHPDTVFERKRITLFKNKQNQ